MNPTFGAFQKAVMTMSINMLMGIEYVPKKDKETSINGRAFAPGHGVQQEESSEVKEAKVRAHLDKLTAECKARYLLDVSKYPEIFEIDIDRQAAEDRGKANDVGYPTIREIAAERHHDAQAYIDRQLAATEDKYPRSDMIVEMEEEQERQKERDLAEEIHAARCLALYGSDNGVEVDQRSTHDMVMDRVNREAEHEHRDQAARDAAIHTGETRFEAQ